MRGEPDAVDCDTATRDAVRLSNRQIGELAGFAELVTPRASQCFAHPALDSAGGLDAFSVQAAALPLRGLRQSGHAKRMTTPRAYAICCQPCGTDSTQVTRTDGFETETRSEFAARQPLSRESSCTDSTPHSNFHSTRP